MLKRDKGIPHDVLNEALRTYLVAEAVTRERGEDLRLKRKQSRCTHFWEDLGVGEEFCGMILHRWKCKYCDVLSYTESKTKKVR